MLANDPQHLVWLQAHKADQPIAAACQDAVLVVLKDGIDRAGVSCTAGEPAAVSAAAIAQGQRAAR